MQKTRILFVCHGNICRSPMAEFILKDMVKKARLDDKFIIRSAATSTEEIGNGLYPPVARCLDRHGIAHTIHCARQIKKTDYGEYDLIIGMDTENMRNMQRLFSPDPDAKLRSLMSFAGENRSVSDPWYTRDFETAYDDIYKGCEALLNYIKKA